MHTIQQKQFDSVKFIANLILAIITILCISSIIGCNPARKVEKAEQIVKLNPASFYKIGLAWQLLNPCANDSIIKFLPGETITEHDTTSNLWHDTLLNWTYDTIRITKNIHKTDTVKISVTDKQQVKVWEDSVRKTNLITSSLQGQILEKDKEVERSNKTAAARLWIIIGIGIVIVLGVVAKIYIK